MAYDNYENLGFQVKVDGADSAVSNLDRIIDRLERINQLQGKKVSVSKQVVNAQKEEEKQTKRNTQSLTSYIGKLTSTVVIARKVAHFISSAIQESSNYIENLNLFAVAFGDTYQQTIDWALNIADAYGLASNEVVRFAGVFRELSTSLGLVDKTADTVTKALTNYGYDLSALFNVSVEQSMEKLQSGIFSGNVRPLRAFGIDISQNQIDNLFKTNEALASMGINARNLSQSDKVIARLVIALQSGTDAFGTMYREINNLQSQFRIFQGSLANFKLAVGDLVQQPIADAMVYINAFIIAITDIIRAFVPLKKIDETPVGNLGAEAEETSDALDNLNGKLADFDKFNVLGGQSSGGSQLAVTEALNKLLEEQVALYDNRLTSAMENATNKAKELSKGIISWFIKFDEEGNIVYKDDMPIWTDNAKALGAGLIALAGIISLKVVDSILGLVKNIFTLKNGMILLNTVLVGGAIFAFVKMVEAFENGEYWAGILAGTIGVTLVGAFVLLHKKAIVGAIGAIVKFIAELWFLNSTALGSTTLGIGALSGAFIGLGAAIAGAFAIFSNWGDMNWWQKTIGIIGVATTAILGLAMAFGAFHSAWSLGLAAAGIAAGIGAIVASIATVKKDIEDPVSWSAHANGGYSNANLIMTHENGKREWVGKAAGSSAIVNDTQMSDIMEVAVAKGVYNALSARSAMGGNVPTNETIVVKIGEEAVFNAVRKTARRQGRDFANV